MRKLFLFLISSLGYLGAAQAQDMWEWQTPQPSAHNLRDVHFFNAQEGIICSFNAQVFRTLDSGQTWDRQTLAPFHVGLHSLHFTSRQQGWVVGSRGSAFKTADGGLTWARMPVTAPDSTESIHLIKVKFVNDQLGFICGESPTLRYIYRTTNGGATWQTTTMRRTEPNATTDEFAWPYDLHFTNNSTGWLVGTGLVAKTVDGGQTWVEHPDFYTGYYSHYSCIRFVSDSVGFLGSAGGGISKTTNGGRTWSPVFSQLGTLSPVKMVFAGPDTGWTVSVGGVFRTYNGGLNWAALTDFRVDGEVRPNSFSFINKNNLVFVGAKGGIIRTTNGGQTLKRSGGFSEVAGTMTFLSDSIVWSAGPGGVLRSADGGKNWQVKQANIWYSYYDIWEKTYLVVNDRNVWYTDYDRRNLFSTYDGGATWQSRYFSDTNNIQSLSFHDARHGLMVTSKYTYTTQDSGRTWNPVSRWPHPTGYPTPRNIQSVTNNRAYGWGAYGFYRTTNKGAAWQLLHPSRYFYHVQFIDSVTGYAASKFSGPQDSARFHVTHDGGVTWALVGNPAQKILSFKMLDAQTGVAFGDTGTMLVTEDGGLTWQAESIHYDTDLLGSINFTPSGYAWVSGAYNGRVRRRVSLGMPTAAKPAAKASKSNLYPNPSRGEFTLNLSASSKVQVFNILGSKVAELGSVGIGRQTINLKPHGKGVYLVRLQSPTGTQAIKAIVE